MVSKAAALAIALATGRVSAGERGQAETRDGGQAETRDGGQAETRDGAEVIALEGASPRDGGDEPEATSRAGETHTPLSGPARLDAAAPSTLEPTPDADVALSRNSTSKTTRIFEPGPRAPPPPDAPAPEPPRVSHFRVTGFFAGGVFLGAENEVHVGGGALAVYHLVSDLSGGVEADLLIIGGTILPTLAATLEYAPEGWFLGTGGGATRMIPSTASTRRFLPVAFLRAGLRSRAAVGGRLGLEVRWLGTDALNLGVLITLGRSWSL